MKLILIILSIFILVIFTVNYVKYSMDMKLLKMYEKNILPNEKPFLKEYPVVDEIPKVIHQTNETLENYLFFDKESKLNNKSCPNYQFKFYNNQDRVEYIKNNYGERILRSYLKISDDFGPCKADLFRYLLLYKEGGIYLDNKSIIMKNLDSYLDKNHGKLLTAFHEFSLYHKINFFSPHNTYYYFNKKYNLNHGEFIQWFIASNPGNKMLKKIIEKIIVNIEAEEKRKKKTIYDKGGVLVLSGPVMFTETILENDCKDCYVMKNFVNNYVKYKIRDHKKVNNKHYSKIQNKSVIM